MSPRTTGLEASWAEYLIVPKLQAVVGDFKANIEDLVIVTHLIERGPTQDTAD